MYVVTSIEFHRPSIALERSVYTQNPCTNAKSKSMPSLQTNETEKIEFSLTKIKRKETHNITYIYWNPQIWNCLRDEYGDFIRWKLQQNYNWQIWICRMHILFKLSVCFGHQTHFCVNRIISVWFWIWRCSLGSHFSYIRTNYNQDSKSIISIGGTHANNWHLYCSTKWTEPIMDEETKEERREKEDRNPVNRYIESF